MTDPITTDVHAQMESLIRQANKRAGGGPRYIMCSEETVLSIYRHLHPELTDAEILDTFKNCEDEDGIYHLGKP